MTANFVLLEKITVGAAGASSVTFNSIPQTGYTDLVVKCSMREATTSDYTFTMTLNGNSSSIYTRRSIQGQGSSASSVNATGTFFEVISNPANSTANTFTSTEFYIPNYTDTTTQKSISADTIAENNATLAFSWMSAQLFASTAAVSSITFAGYSGNLAANSTFYLYGVAKLGTTPAIVPYATGGDTIMTDGTYWYHTFTSSGTFTPQKAITCDYLVVAGGGGSAAGAGTSGGGGGGGVRCTVGATGGGGSLESPLSLASGTGYTVTIGAGGAGTSGAIPGNNGNNSVFSTITSIGGGYGGGPNPYQNGGSGGSGGGGGEQSSIYGTGGAGTTNQGYAGAQGGSSPYRSGGGGGAGQAGNTNANGGNGIQTSISGTATYYGGGGGGGGTTGGTGGLGGGGTGSTVQVGQTAGTANTGGGAGGMYVGNGLNGGSGIVIVRYAV